MLKSTIWILIFRSCTSPFTRPPPVTWSKFRCLELRSGGQLCWIIDVVGWASCLCGAELCFVSLGDRNLWRRVSLTVFAFRKCYVSRRFCTLNNCTIRCRLLFPAPRRGKVLLNGIDLTFLCLPNHIFTIILMSNKRKGSWTLRVHKTWIPASYGVTGLLKVYEYKLQLRRNLQCRSWFWTL